MRVRRATAAATPTAYPRHAGDTLPGVPHLPADAPVAAYEAVVVAYTDEHAASLGRDPYVVAMAAYVALTAPLFRGIGPTGVERWGRFGRVTFQESSALRDRLHKQYRPDAHELAASRSRDAQRAAERHAAERSKITDPPAPF